MIIIIYIIILVIWSRTCDIINRYRLKPTSRKHYYRFCYSCESASVADFVILIYLSCIIPARLNKFFRRFLGLLRFYEKMWLLVRGSDRERNRVRAALMKVHSSLGRRSRYPPYKSNAFHRGSIKPYGSLKNATGLGPD